MAASVTSPNHDVLDVEQLFKELRPIPFEVSPDAHVEVSHLTSLERLRLGEVARLDPSVIAGIFGELTRQTASPWAVIVVTFRDDPAPPALHRYEQVFTAAGAGTLNMVDYFADMSHGVLDLSGTRVFGPYVIDRPRSDYVGNVNPAPAGKLNRGGILDVGRAMATAAGVDLSAFTGVVVCGTPQLDLCGWVGGFAALCDDNSLQPSLLGQEMGHGYGADHSRRNGSDDDYQDPWDTMSTANAYMANHPTYGAVGPGLNAWNMRMRGWLNEGRVRVIDTTHSGEQTITLRPLHARQLHGPLAVEVGPYLVEFRARARWDAGIPRPCVLVHRAESNRSYVMAGSAGNEDLVAGDHFEIGRPGGLFAEHILINVDAIDTVNQTATITVTHEPANRPRIPQEVGTIFGGIASDGPGIFVVGGKVIPVPPRGPERALVESVIGLLEARSVAERTGRAATRMEALGPVLRAIGAVARDIEVISDTPPGLERLQ